MKIAVCVKQIPDPATPYDLDPETHFVQRPEDQVLDDTDRYGIEAGLQLAEESESEVVLVSMSPAGSLQGIRQALAMGADKAVVIDDEGLRGAGALVTATIDLGHFQITADFPGTPAATVKDIGAGVSHFSQAIADFAALAQ